MSLICTNVFCLIKYSLSKKKKKRKFARCIQIRLLKFIQMIVHSIMHSLY